MSQDRLSGRAARLGAISARADLHCISARARRLPTSSPTGRSGSASIRALHPFDQIDSHGKGTTWMSPISSASTLVSPWRSCRWRQRHGFPRSKRAKVTSWWPPLLPPRSARTVAFIMPYAAYDISCFRAENCGSEDRRRPQCALRRLQPEHQPGAIYCAAYGPGHHSAALR